MRCAFTLFDATCQVQEILSQDSTSTIVGYSPPHGPIPRQYLHGCRMFHNKPVFPTETNCHSLASLYKRDPVVSIRKNASRLAGRWVSFLFGDQVPFFFQKCKFRAPGSSSRVVNQPISFRSFACEIASTK